MRIISQNKDYDFPYNNIAIKIENMETSKERVFIVALFGGGKYILGNYRKIQAQSILEDIYNHYVNRCARYFMPEK